MEKHVTWLGWLYIIFNGLIALLAMGAFISGPLTGALAISPGQTTFFVLIATPGLVGGVGLLKRWPWARNVGLFLGALSLLNFPIGTILGAYTFWVLWPAKTARLFDS